MKRSKNYRKIWELHNNQKIPKGFHVHHLDGDRTNDDPGNLICVSPEEHVRLHLTMGDKIINGNFILKANNLKGRVRPIAEREKISQSKRGIATHFPTEAVKLKMSVSHGARPFLILKAGKIVGKWISISECARQLNLNRGNLSSCLHGKIPHVEQHEAKYLEG